MIAIINYGSGNVNAISNLFRKHNINFEITIDSDAIDRADSIILPGVGAFDATMNLLHNTGMFDVLNEQVLHKKKNILGVCVGMQVMAEASEEGSMRGFGWIPGVVKKIKVSGGVKPTLPHMGWNCIKHNGDPLLQKIDCDLGFYFLHSFYFETSKVEHVSATCKYFHDFPCVLRNDNIYGTQFHPEKSHSNGVQLLKNYAGLTKC
jgi:imidazole glycerol-phosphate synthase subunit HisH